MIANSAWILFAIFAAIVFFDSVPPRLFDPIWLITTATALVSAASIPLVAVVIVHIAAALAPLNPSIYQIQRRISRLAAWLALVYLLLIPLLGFATWRGIVNVRQTSSRQAVVISRNVDRLYKAIDSAGTTKQLQQNMAQLNGPQVADQELTVPLDQLKASARRVIDQLRKRYIEELPKPQSEVFKPIYLQALRAAALALISSIGFASLSWDPLKQQSLLQSLFSPKNEAALSPAGFSKRLRKAFSTLLSPFKADPSKESTKRFWVQQRDREKRASALRAKEVKRNADKLQKALQQRERKRRLEERKRERERQINRRRGGGDEDD